MPYVNGTWFDKPQAPNLTKSEKASMVAEAVQELERAAILNGATPEQAKDIAKSNRDKFRVQVTIGGAAVQVQNEGVWGLLTFEAGVDRLAFSNMQRIRRIAEHGEEPSATLQSQLVAAGLSSDRAAEIAEARTYRDQDGRIAVRFATGERIRHGEFWLEHAVREIVANETAAARAEQTHEYVLQHADSNVAYEI